MQWEIISTLISVAQHVQHVAAGSSQRKSRRTLAQLNDPVDDGLLYKIKHAFSGWAIIAQWP